MNRNLRYVTVGLVAATCFLPSAMLRAQHALGVGPSKVSVKAHNVLMQLGDGRLEEALKTLGEAVDLAAPLDASQVRGIPAAAAGVHRKLAQLRGDERFDLLYAWSMPREDRRSVRILSTAVPQDAPPSAFARTLGERPRTDSFAIASIGGLRGLFSTGWMLAEAADEIGRSSRLVAELESLTAEGVPNADTLLLFAKLAAGRVAASEVAAELRRRVAGTAEKGAESDPPQAIDVSNIVLAAAALRHEELRAVSEEMFVKLAEVSDVGSSNPWRAFLRIAHAVAVQRNRGTSNPDVLYRNRLKYWVPATGRTSAEHAAGAVNAMWLVHEDHILHLAGAAHDVLFCRFPLTGNFDFTCEAQEGGKIGTDGGLVYGGLQFEALGNSWQLSVWDADLAQRVQKACPFVRHGERATYNRLSIRSNDDGATFAVNLHPMWFDNAAAHASPWLGLRSFGEKRPAFRNLSVTGTPVIPRKVDLSQGNQLRGWQSHFFGETQPSFDSSAKQPGEGRGGGRRGIDWHIADGEIHAARREAENTSSQSLLHYQRPLLEGEAVAYEFFYKRDSFEVHPALGRLALLVEPNGVRAHWITDGVAEWTGLPADNALLEPLNRRGPRTVPLRDNSWNAVALSRTGGKVLVALNDTVIYERDVDDRGDHTFGFFRNPSKAAARIRNVVMSGDWPETLPEEFVENPTVVAERQPQKEQ